MTTTERLQRWMDKIPVGDQPGLATRMKRDKRAAVANQRDADRMTARRLGCRISEVMCRRRAEQRAASR